MDSGCVYSYMKRKFIALCGALICLAGFGVTYHRNAQPEVFALRYGQISMPEFENVVLHIQGRERRGALEVYWCRSLGHSNLHALILKIWDKEADSGERIYLTALACVFTPPGTTARPDFSSRGHSMLSQEKLDAELEDAEKMQPQIRERINKVRQHLRSHGVVVSDYRENYH